MQVTPSLWQKEPLVEGDRGEWKSWLKTQHSKNEDHGVWSLHFMANRWGRNGNSGRLYFLGHQNHCRWWLQLWHYKMLAPWKNVYDKCRQCIKKQRHHFADKSPYSQSYGFPVVMYGCESWTIKKAEPWKIDTFRSWCWRRLLKVPWTARKSTLNIHWKNWWQK